MKEWNMDNVLGATLSFKISMIWWQGQYVGGNKGSESGRHFYLFLLTLCKLILAS